MIEVTYLFEWERKDFVNGGFRSLSLETVEELQAVVTGGLLDFYEADENPKKVEFWFEEITNSLTIYKNKSSRTGNPVWQISFSLRIFYKSPSNPSAPVGRVKLYLKRFSSSIYGLMRQVETTLSFLGDENKYL